MLYKTCPADIKGYGDFFKANSKDGIMGPAELKTALEKAGADATGDEVKAMINAVSVDEAGMNWQCFIDYVSSYQVLVDVEGEYEEAFRIYDQSGSGTLSRADIKEFMGKLGVTIDVDSLMDAVDTNKDGVIQFEEFVAMMKKSVI